MTDANLMDLLIHSMQQEVYEVNEANGWFEADRSAGDDTALLHTEVSEWFESFRNNEPLLWFEHKGDCPEALRSDVQFNTDPAPEGCTCTPKPQGMASEAADILIRLLDVCRRYEIDLGQAYRIKHAYNATRGYKHGGKAI